MPNPVDIRHRRPIVRVGWPQAWAQAPFSRRATRKGGFPEPVQIKFDITLGDRTCQGQF